MSPRYVEVKALSPEMQKKVLEQMKKEGRFPGPVSGTPALKSELLWCGHPKADIVKDSQGADTCPHCTRSG